MRNPWQRTVCDPDTGQFHAADAEAKWASMVVAQHTKSIPGRVKEVLLSALRVRWAARHACKRLRGERDELNLVLKNVAQEVQEIRRQAAIDAAHGGETNDSSAKMAEQILTHLDAALGPDRVRLAKDEDAALDEAYAKMNDELIKQRDSMTEELGKALGKEHMSWAYLIGFAESIRGAVNACQTREELATQLADVERQLAESANRLDELRSRIIAVRDHIAEAGNPTSGKVVIEMLDELVEEGDDLGLMHDRVHYEPGNARAARTVRVKK